MEPIGIVVILEEVKYSSVIIKTQAKNLISHKKECGKKKNRSKDFALDKST